MAAKKEASKTTLFSVQGLKIPSVFQIYPTQYVSIVKMGDCLLGDANLRIEDLIQNRK